MYKTVQHRVNGTSVDSSNREQTRSVARAFTKDERARRCAILRGYELGPLEQTAFFPVAVVVSSKTLQKIVRTGLAPLIPAPRSYILYVCTCYWRRAKDHLQDSNIAIVYTMHPMAESAINLGRVRPNAGNILEVNTAAA